MENIIFEIQSRDKDKHGAHLFYHVTEEINCYIVWISPHTPKGREYAADLVFLKRDIAIIYAVEKARGVCL